MQHYLKFFNSWFFFYFFLINNKSQIHTYTKRRGPVDAAALINNTSTGEIAEWDDVEKIKVTLKKYYAMYKVNELKAHPIHLEKYHRKNLTQELIKILN
jgi:hypothetical protein